MEDEEKVEQESADLAPSKSKKDPCNIGKGVCYEEQFGPEMPQGNKKNTEYDLKFLDKLVAANSAYYNNKKRINDEFQKH